MQVRRSRSGLVVQTPAKLNLFFEVLARRTDGYHEIESLVCPIDLYDTLVFREDASGQVKLGCLRIRGSSISDGCHDMQIPVDADNLAVRAVELVRRHAGVRQGATLELVKRIPIAAGLGGGSSDAAAALVAANTYWNLGLSRTELARLGSELGSDVPLFLYPCPVLCRGRGERIEPVATWERLHFVIVRPPMGLSTAAVYGVCRPARVPRSSTPLIEALADGNLPEAGRRMFNRLESAAESLSDWIARLRGALEGTDCLGHQMSGSGSCYFGLCRNARHARALARRLGARPLGKTYALQGCR